MNLINYEYYYYYYYYPHYYSHYYSHYYYYYYSANNRYVVKVVMTLCKYRRSCIFDERRFHYNWDDTPSVFRHV